MSDYTILNITDVEDQAASHGLAPGLESRFARNPLETTQLGVTRFEIAPGFRVPFGHSHGEHEEVYVVVRGSARIKLDDEIRELKEWDLIRIAGPVVRALEGGPEGAEILAVGAPIPADSGEFVQDWWKD